tara:strand:+ start:400 stop:747 length:348 start_codon:yes stop_codon:yes gene_type:complete
MKIKFKHAVIIWSVLALTVVGVDIISEQPNYVDNASAKQSESNKGEYPFVVNAFPKDAKVRIMNIGPKYQEGMMLPKGKYDIEVSKDGYKPERVWVEHIDDSVHMIRLKRRGRNG